MLQVCLFSSYLSQIIETSGEKYTANDEYYYQFYLYSEVGYMIELYELRQFAAFASAGTLLEAAEVLHLSQPALSRNMKKLEEDLGIPLFIRKKNRLELNENGKYVFTLAQKLLTDADSLVEKAQTYDRKNRTILLGSVPGTQLVNFAAARKSVSEQNPPN